MFRLGYNKYLEELNIKPDSYPFDKDKSNRYKKGTGFNDYLTWSLGYNLAIFTYCYIRRLEEVSDIIDWEYHKNNGDFDFKLATEGLKDFIAKDQMEITEKDMEEFRKTWNYIGEHISYLWW